MQSSGISIAHEDLAKNLYFMQTIFINKPPRIESLLVNTNLQFLKREISDVDISDKEMQRYRTESNNVKRK